MRVWRRWTASLAALALFGCSPDAALTPDEFLRAGYTADEIDYFGAIALGAEWGEATELVRKWSGPIRIRVSGAPTEDDRLALADVVRDLNELIRPLSVAVVEAGGNVDLNFVPREDFARLEPFYVPGNVGFVWVGWNGKQQIDRARVLIPTDHVSQQQRSHLIREELTQALGLLRDSDRYPESVFYEGWSETTEYAPIDRAVIGMLYRREVRTGMPGPEARAALFRLPR